MIQKNLRTKYDEAFKECFLLDEGDDLATLAYQSIEAWDSVGHMSLVGMIEDSFSILLEMDDIIDFSSYEQGILILQKYGINLTIE